MRIFPFHNHFSLYVIFRWACGTKNLLSKLEDGLLPRSKSHDIFEEISKTDEPLTQLENDEDVFGEKNTKSTKWKFVGDCAYMIDDEELLTPNRKRYTVKSHFGKVTISMVQPSFRLNW